MKNLRADHSRTLGRGFRTASYTAGEVSDPEAKFTVMRTYLECWNMQVKSLMGVSKASPDADLRAIIDKHPVFILKRA